MSDAAPASGKIARFRESLKKNEIFFDVGVGVVVAGMVTIAGVIVSYSQLQQSNQQTQYMKRQTEYMERQTQLVDVQTKLTERQMVLTQTTLSPRWVFDHEKNPNEWRLQIKNAGTPANSLEGQCVVFVKVGRPGDEKRIRVRNFFGSEESKTMKTGTLYFYEPKGGANGHSWIDGTMEGYKPPFEIMYYVKLVYFDVTGEKRTEQMVVNAVYSYLVQPVAAMPAMDTEVVWPSLTPEEDFAKVLDRLGVKKK